jgi:hydrogenase maturation protein HypF
MVRRELVAVGIVQGVGFRPHVYRVARELGVTGSVANTAAGVVIDAHGPASVLDELARRVVAEVPPLASVREIRAAARAWAVAPAEFVIVPSAEGQGPRTSVPPDTAVCDDCLRELFDPADRRHRHPFITCTNCGPRFTIITALPYDRPRTSMAGFALCPDCDREYRDPADRRFHAQPVSCPDCGPRLWADDGQTRTDGDEAALARAQQVLAAGGTVAVKGLGGFHLACRADLPEAVARLRERKRRPDKPFALMASSPSVAARVIQLDPAGTALLTDPARPIVLAPRRPDIEADVVADVAPGLGELGVMLAYTPLHHLLMAPGPAGLPVSDLLVMTSANLGDEPLCYRDDQISLLWPLADLVLGHDRPIVTPCDDSVFRVIDGQVSPVRRSRGYAPLPVRLDRDLPATFAVGAELKNTVCVLDGRDAVCSQHLGDMAGWESQRTLAETSAHVMGLYEVDPTRWAADAHPAYQTREWARRFATVPLIEVQHHRAHAASLLAENQLLGTPCLVVCFDGTGYGDDGVAWGGEWLLAGADVLSRGQAAIHRVASLAEVAMVGGDAAVREPWRLALAHLRRARISWNVDLPPVTDVPAPERDLLAAVLDGQAFTTRTTSMGRLFDAVSALLGVRQKITYEAQAAIELEHLAATAASGDPAGWIGDAGVASAGGWTGATADDGRAEICDPAAMLGALVDGLLDGRDRAELALGFHVWVARAVLDEARTVRARTGVDHVGLTGGVFANVLLVRSCTALLSADGFDVVHHRLVPCNDGGLSLGQAVLAAATTKE